MNLFKLLLEASDILANLTLPVFLPCTSTATAIKLLPSAPLPLLPDFLPPRSTSSTSMIPFSFDRLLNSSFLVDNYLKTNDIKM